MKLRAMVGALAGDVETTVRFFTNFIFSYKNLLHCGVHVIWSTWYIQRIHVSYQYGALSNLLLYSFLLFFCSDQSSCP